jgi:hypothetical protein
VSLLIRTVALLLTVIALAAFCVLWGVEALTDLRAGAAKFTNRKHHV